MTLKGNMPEAELAELKAYVSDVSLMMEDMLHQLLPEVDDTNAESRLHEAMRYSIFAGGKRLRPVLVMACNDLFGGNKHRALRVAAAMEVLHTYSLIHDDLPCMDDDDLRRGKPTCHVKYDEATAVLAGDALLTLAFEILADEATHPEGRVRVALVKLFAQAAGANGMIGGQMLDILAEGHQDEMDQGALARLQRKKTGALFSACCEAAVILNGAGSKDNHRLTSYARNIGLAFQMVDDVLDETGDSAETGKNTGGDKLSAKATFAHLLGVDGAMRQARFLCAQAVDYLGPYNSKARVLELLAQFVVARAH